MNFIDFRAYSSQLRVNPDKIIEEIDKYLSIDLVKTLRDLNTGLVSLSIQDNFDSFAATVTIAAGAEARIRNEMPSKVVPLYRMVIRGGSGAQNVVDGDTAWSKDFVYLKNTGGSSTTVTVVFFR